MINTFLLKLGKMRFYFLFFMWVIATVASCFGILPLVYYIYLNLFFLVLTVDCLYDTNSVIDNIQKRIYPRLQDIFFNLLKRSNNLTEDFKQARSVWILAKTGRGFFKNFGDSIKKVPSKRFLLIKPERFNDYFRYIKVEWNQPTQNKYIKFLNEEICSQVNQGGLKVTDFLAPWTLIIINPDDDNSKIYVELGDYKSTAESRYSFVIEKDKDCNLYEYFKKQFEKIWEEAQDWC